MVYNINDDNFFEYIVKYKKVIWFFFRKEQEQSSLSLKPFIDGVDSVNMEVSKEYPEVTFFQTVLEENPMLIEYLNLTDNNLWNHKSKCFNPRIITVKNGQNIYDQAGKKCYCLETLLDMIFDLHPELVLIPPSE
tara:strand:- start:329 stop:733 length:405 start_codon:yes stop_codon:yes gene_type:complete